MRSWGDILFLLDEVSDVAISAEQCKRMQFNPMFSCFETVRDYCVLFLENSVSFHYKNSLKLFAFLLPMEYVFEDFIFGFINKEIEGVNPNGQVAGTYLDEAKTFGLKPDLILDLGIKRVIADTKYKLVYTNETDPKKGISQTDLYQMIAYAIRFKIDEIKLFYPNTITSKDNKQISEVVVIDELVGKLPITITTHQLSILEKSINSLFLSEFDNFMNGFEGLRLRLKGELEEALGLV
ncbi:MAG: 5-methylcytosine restriction system specificity protein McrC [Flavobacterium macrobrachii]